MPGTRSRKRDHETKFERTIDQNVQRQGYGRTTIETLTFITGFIVTALLLVGSLQVPRLLSIVYTLEASYKANQIEALYLSSWGLYRLAPWDVLSVVFLALLFLTVITLRVLAEAQAVREKDRKRSDALLAKADKYTEWSLVGTVFFMSMEFLSTLFVLRYVIIQGDVWLYLVLSLALAIIVHRLMHRILNVGLGSL